MAYFLVDDQLHSHPKVRRAGLEALGLWTIAGSHCRAYKSDGFVPEWVLVSWPKYKQNAAKLVAAGLWEVAEKDGENGWIFRDWLDVHDPAEVTEKQREQGRERQRKRRARLREEKGMDL